MKSIRLSLVVYFLLLLAAALGAVCALVYQTAAAAIRERRDGSQKQIEAQYKTHREEVLSGLDRRLLRQAQTVATMTRSPLHVEALYPLGVMGVPFTGQVHLYAPLWLAEGTHRDLRDRLFRMRNTEIDIEAAEDLLPPPEPGHAREYFQVLVGDGQPAKRSQSLGPVALSLDPEVRRELADPPHEHFDTIPLTPDGPRVRRVTLKASLTRFQHGGFPAFMWRFIPGRPGKMGGPPPNGPQGGPPGGPPRPSVFETEAPTIYIQYAVDLEPTEARLLQFAAERDRQLAELDSDTADQLRTLRGRLWWIALLTFAGTLAGGYLLLRLGLAPLARLSEAVSEVSERDFRLKVEPARLPAELQPIAERLSQTLRQLGQAFDREKQASADISHELRTPLAALLTTIEVALRKSRSAQEYREILEECQSSGQQMQLLVERLLALARLDAGADRARPRGVDAARLALACADLVRPLARARDVTLTAHVTPPLPVETDPDKLREVLTNLLHNAVEYNRTGGSIDLTVSRENGTLVMEVRDTGIGIRADARQRIFERFYRADPSRHADSPHAGLGLAIVKSYVDLLGGTIAVDSVPDEGSTFRVCLPVHEAARDPELVTASAAPVSGGNGHP
jgi:heavy metal sensor kinase